MARPFLEEQIDLCARYGTNFDEIYSVTNTQTAGGESYALLHHPYPTLRYELNFDNVNLASARDEIMNVYHRSFGTFGGFRLRNTFDRSTNNGVGVPTHTDQKLIPAVVSPSTKRFQFVRWYGVQVVGTSPHRILRKLVAGSALVAIDGVLQGSGFTVDYNTGIVEFDSAPSSEAVITGGCYFDIPVRFEAPVTGAIFSNYGVMGLSINLIEILNP